MPKSRGHFVPKSVSYVWKIKNFLDQKGKLCSPKFLLSNAQFSIIIYPDGKSRDHAGYVSLYLYKSSSRTESHVFCTLLLKRADGSVFNSLNFSYLFPPENRSFGYHKFIKRSDLTRDENILGSRGILNVLCNVHDVRLEEHDSAEEDDDSTVEAETQTSFADTIEMLSKDLEEIYVSGCQTDVVMDVRGKKFSAHRLILSARSTVFQSMFEGNMKERETGVISITDCDPESFEAFLLFLYSGKLDVVTSDNALDLYTTADMYNIQKLKKECGECLVRDLSVDSVCDVLRLAKTLGDRKLLDNATTYFVKNANKILTTMKWQTLMSDDSTLADELFIKMAGT